MSSVTLALAISFEPHEFGVMQRPPRTVDRPLLDRFGIWRIAFISLLLLIFTFGTFFWLTKHGASLELSRTAAVNAMIVGQVFYLVNSRFLLDSCFSLRALMGNKWIPISIGGVIILQMLFTYAPFMQAIFGTEALPLSIWGWLLLGGFVFFTLVEVRQRGGGRREPCHRTGAARRHQERVPRPGPCATCRRGGPWPRPDLDPALLVPPQRRFARGWLAEALSERGEGFRRFEQWSQIVDHLAC